MNEPYEIMKSKVREALAAGLRVQFVTRSEELIGGMEWRLECLVTVLEGTPSEAVDQSIKAIAALGDNDDSMMVERFNYYPNTCYPEPNVPVQQFRTTIICITA